MSLNDIIVFLLLFGTSIIAALVVIVIWFSSSQKTGSIEPKNTDDIPISHTRLYNHISTYIEITIQRAKNLWRLALSIYLIGLITIGYELFRLLQQDPPLNYLKHFPWIVVGLSMGLIGTFVLFIYRSTVEQTKSYFETLERLTNINMSVDVISRVTNFETDIEPKVSAVADFATHLLEISNHTPSQKKKTD